MKLARYWTRAKGEALTPAGDRVEVTARGWSNESINGALQVARETAQRVAAAVASGETKGQKYVYGDRPLPEQLVQEFRSDGDEPTAVVTRNVYGALVLNARDLMFADIDREHSSSTQTGGGGLIDGIMSLFSKPASGVRAESPVVADVRRIAERHNLGMRLYKTAGGYRALITTRTFRAGSPESEALLKELGSDPMYVRLCRVQESFRARLTPKPWRCGSRTPPVRFPYESSADQQAFNDWEARYSEKAGRCATCEFIGDVGAGQPLADFSDLIAFHDQQTKAFSGLPLA